MQHCTQCGAASPDDASSCQRCGHPFDRGKQQKKQRSFLAGLLLLLGIRRNPQTGSLGCALVPTVSVALVAVIIIGAIVGPVLKLIPPFAPGLTVIGNVVPGGSVDIHGTNFPAGSRINLTLDGVSIGLAPNSRHSMPQSLYDISLSAVQVSPLQRTEKPSSPASNITVRDDGTFDAQISIPKGWQPNSQHIIQAQAIGQDGSVQTQVQQTVTIPGSPSGGTLTQGPPNPSPTTPISPSVTPTGSPSASSCAASTTGTGTDLTFTFPGATPCPMSVVRNDGCQVSTTLYQYHFDVLGRVNGTLYTFVLITAAYYGPRTYTANWVVALDIGDTTSTGPGNGWRAQFTGTVTVNSDEKSGRVDALLNNNVNTSGTVHVTGTWACS